MAIHKLAPALCQGQHLQLWTLLHYRQSLSKKVRLPLKATEVHIMPDQEDKFLPVLSKFSLHLSLRWRQQTVKHQRVNEWLQEAIAVPLQSAPQGTCIAMRDHIFTTCPHGLAESTEVSKGWQGRVSASSADVGLHHAAAAQAQSNICK